MNRTLTETETSELEKKAEETIDRLQRLYNTMSRMSDEEILDEYSRIFLDHPPIEEWEI